MYSAFPSLKSFSVGVIWIGIFATLTACSGNIEKPEKGSQAYRQVISDFYVSLAAIQADQAIFAIEKMEEVAERYPNEASAWANLGVFAMRQGNFTRAKEHLDRALDLSGDNAEIVFLAGILESRRGNVDASVEYLRKAAQLDPENPQIAYSLAQELERQDANANSDEVVSILQSIMEANPDNLAVLLEIVRTSVKWNYESALESAMEVLDKKSENWPEEVSSQFQEVRQTILSEEGDDLTFQLAFLRNNLNQLPNYQSDLAAVQIPQTQVGFLITSFSWLEQPSTSVAAADTALSFSTSVLSSDNEKRVGGTAAFSDDPEVDRIVIGNNSAVINNEIELAYPGEINSKYGYATIDFDYDFINDLAFAGSAGFRFYRQQEDSTFSDITSTLELPSSVLSGRYLGIWSRDIDLDGDLDIVLSRQSEATLVLRNNGDGTFDSADWFSSITQPVNFEWADLDGDTDSDAVFIDDNGEVTLLLNERSLNFTRVEDLPQSSGVFDIEVADINNNGDIDLLIWNADGVHRVYFEQSTATWEQETLIEPGNEYQPDNRVDAHLYAIDIDNNGANDIVISHSNASAYWLNGETLQISEKLRALPAGIQGIADLNGDTRLDVIGINSENKVYEGINSGAKGYLARIIRPRASGPMGDQRINSFGIGGEIEIRSGLLYQKQIINEPWVHLGLGTYEEAEVLRITWPNGSSQAEFAELGYGTKIFNEQILKGSCPWVFTHNGNEMEFVTDFLWRTGLGIRINAQGDADVIHSVDWIKIGGDQLKPRDGYYDIRITADLWETHFFDHLSLMAVDHPSDTEVFVDERFTFPPQQPDLHAIKELQPVAKATDQDGNDVTEKIRHRDREFVDSFNLTKYQGIAEDHFIEVDLGDQLSDTENLKLIASGWIYPTDTSVNIAISQGSGKAPQPLRLEVPDGNGKWKIVRQNIGFPAGKSKTMVIDLDGIFEPGTERKVRLATSMEIYWNQIQWGRSVPDMNLEKQTLAFSKAELRYRGFSDVERPSRFQPEIPNYQKVAGTTPMWSDLKGFYTRFGEVGELLNEIDDRYVIMNAGDELVFEFPALEEPEEGQNRDFVLVGDGWVKDGDYNTGFSTTVLPLPYHGMEDYSRAPAGLENDPVFQKHREDWINFHTPEAFRHALTFDKEQ